MKSDKSKIMAIVSFIPCILMLLSILLSDDHGESARGYYSLFIIFGGYLCLLIMAFFVGIIADNNKASLIVYGIMLLSFYSAYYLRMFEYIYSPYETTDYIVYIPLGSLIISFVTFIIGFLIRNIFWKIKKKSNAE